MLFIYSRMHIIQNLIFSLHNATINESSVDNEIRIINNKLDDPKNMIPFWVS